MSPVDVTLVRWPAEAPRRERLAEKNAPRLLLVEDGEPPPAADDCLEDWIRLPAADADLKTRLAALATRASRHLPATPDLDADGVLRFRSAWASLPPVEARLAAVMLERFSAVVSRDSLSRAGWPTGAPGRNALDVHVLRLRRRLLPVGLVIRTVRSRGYLLETGADERATADA